MRCHHITVALISPPFLSVIDDPYQYPAIYFFLPAMVKVRVVIYTRKQEKKILKEEKEK